MLQAAHASRRDHRHVDCVRDRAGEPKIETAARAIAVHAGKQDFARAEPDRFACPKDRIPAGRGPAAVRIHLPSTRRDRFGVDGGDDALCAVAPGRLFDERRIVYAGGIDAHLVGAGIEQRADVVYVAHASSDRQGYEHLVGHRTDHLVEQAARLHACPDIEEGELVGALAVVAPRDFDRVAGIAQVDEIDAFDNAARGYVEAGNDALGETHG